MTAKDILNKHTCNGQISTNFGIIQAMEEYATQQVEEMKGELEKALDMLEECHLQLQYMDHRFPTGTTANVLSRAETFLNSLKQQ